MRYRHRPVHAVLLALLAVLVPVLLACTGDDGGSEDEEDRPASAGSSSPTAAASPASRPAAGACYQLTWDQALAPTSDAAPVRCGSRHTSVTFAVGSLDDLLAGHLLGVDSAAVQEQVASTCPKRLRRYVGGSTEDLRLSMLRAVWFTPTVAQSDTGASWYRCELIAVARDGRLAGLSGRLRGVLDGQAGRDRYGMCATAAPDEPDFERVICSARHTWRAVATVDLPGRRYPGAAAARRAGQGVCEDAGRDRAEDPLSFQWGYEWPTRRQWANGQTYGRCWVPD